MTKIRTVIIDDEKRSTLALHDLLSQYCPEVAVSGSAHSKDEGIELILGHRPNLVFLDVEMPGGSGFDLLGELPSRQFGVVFVTGFGHYALKAIKFHALDYLLKPVDIRELIQVVERAKSNLQRKNEYQQLAQLLKNLDISQTANQKMAIPTADGIEFITVREIIRLQAERAYTWFHLKGGERLMSSRNMGEYEKLLPCTGALGSHRFVRPHHRHLVNIHYIRSVNGREAYVQMSNGDQVPVSQRKKAAFMASLEGLGTD